MKTTMKVVIYIAITILTWLCSKIAYALIVGNEPYFYIMWAIVVILIVYAIHEVIDTLRNC
ncbi:MAG: hypothetical protein WCR68_02175 [Candidatus Dojkabacteria bacterium]|jgi:hypothetical protein